MRLQLKAHFPALNQKVSDQRLVYLDSAASALKPKAVIDALTQFYSYEASNVHRGIHTLSARATKRFEEARCKIQKFINASEDREILFCSGTTGAINLLAQTWGKTYLKEGDEIVLSEMEHHSNLVPWQMLAKELGCRIRFIPVTDEGELDQTEYKKILNKKTKLVTVTHCSNTLGTINPVKEMAKMAHAVGAVFAVDGAQSITCMPIDVQDLDCDFFAFSAHKLFGPYGFGCLYGKATILEGLPPYQGGGSMIANVSLEETTFNEIPFRFEAGTPNISGAIGLGVAIDYVTEIGMDKIAAHEKELTVAAMEQLNQIKGLRIVGPKNNRAAILSFVIDGLHPNDIGEILDQEGVAVRTGHHCTQPLMKRFGVTATVRASFSIYNDHDDIDRLCRGVNKAKELLG